MRAIPWWTLLSFRNTAVGANIVFEHVTLGQHVLFPTFRVVCTSAPTAGRTLQVKLRFGFIDADADAATQGIDFTALGALNASETRSPVWVSAAAAPGFPGQPWGILPPRMAVLLTTVGVGGFDGIVTLSYAGLETS
jgi:hypothetical protein